MGKPLSWKWRLTIAFVALFFVSLVMIFTEWGTDALRGWPEPLAVHVIG